MFPFKSIKRVVFLLKKLRLEILWVWIYMLESYLLILVTKLKILVKLFVKKLVK